MTSLAKKPHIRLLILVILMTSSLLAQYPQYFSYDDETGLPSNEVYSMLQDKKGFIWIGCDAGLYKFDGVRYISYKCSSQHSKAISGLTRSSSERLYCYNFQSQIFYLDNDSLKELRHKLSNVINLVSDTMGNIYVAHFGGISRYNETQNTWHHYQPPASGADLPGNALVSKVIKGSLRSSIHFIYPKGIAGIVNYAVKLHHRTNLFEQTLVGTCEIEQYHNEFWVFEREGGLIYHFSGNSGKKLNNTPLSDLLSGRKINNVRLLADSNLWICTYNGIVCFNPRNGNIQLFYPGLSFSDCLIDHERNYWFSTLQTGMLRVPDLDFITWGEHNRLTKIGTDSTHIYFSTVNGTIGRLNTQTQALSSFSTGSGADVQSLDYDPADKTLWFNVNNHLFGLKNNTLLEKENDIPAVKSIRRFHGTVFAASSHGVFINGKKISSSWAREIRYDEARQCLWVATNQGLQKFSSLNGEWRMSHSLFDSIQVISIDYDIPSRQLWAITFDGKIYAVRAGTGAEYIASLPPDVQASRIRYFKGLVYIASNRGVYIRNINDHSELHFNNLAGLASDNIQDLVILNGHLWVASGKGLQQIPLTKLRSGKPLSGIYLKNKNFDPEDIELNYGQALVLLPEVNAYSSNGRFQYAYRLKDTDGDWTKLPATVEEISIPNIPSSKFEIELKALDYWGRDSENIILLQGRVRPPLWETWWFTLLLTSALGGLIFLGFRKTVANIRKREEERTQLVNSQLTALKAQMNPHFMYNTLNSIQALILKQDIRNSNLYLSRFSHLMRQVLDVSGKEEISLAEEAEILELYLSLEKLRFGDHFSYQISISADIDSHNTYLPPLILQPFVENAIKHGLLHKKGEKHLLISLEKERNSLVCRIRDNGIGRKRSEEIKLRQQEKHRSFSTEATRKRLELLNHTRHKKISLEILDLYDQQQPSGTEVIIRIG
jgi:ligand-binding sensor domain-containing protein